MADLPVDATEPRLDANEVAISSEDHKKLGKEDRRGKYRNHRDETQQLQWVSCSDAILQFVKNRGNGRKIEDDEK